MWRPGLDHLWAAYLDHGCSTVKNGAKSYIHTVLEIISYIVLFLNMCCCCKVVCSHGMLRLSIWGLRLHGNCWSVCSTELKPSGWIMGGQNCWGQYKWNSMLKQECREGYLSFLDESSICNPWDGMEGVCKDVINVHDLMGWEFSLLTQWMPDSEWGSPFGWGISLMLRSLWPVSQQSLWLKTWSLY